ncbi:MAG TPA: tetratricopeptide repeat protein [Pirellulaceae bacterium]|nr:tetratricopeptide repeat protein [Pirellulaceae bacterium]
MQRPSRLALSSIFLGLCFLSLAQAQAPTAKPPLFDGLGTHGRQVTTNSPEAQRFFNQALAFLYAFNHDEAIRSFEQAAKIDPDCAMAWWGVAYANGPHINNPVVPEPRAKAAWAALTKAKAAAESATQIEKDLIQALAKRYAEEQPEHRQPLDEAFAAAMREVWKKHPTDADVGALFAESLMDLRPWDLWTLDYQPQPGAEEVIATLEAALTQNPEHPLALHLYIHAVEASPQPEKAAAPADRLRDLTPGLGHLVHMPSHIDVRLGAWKKAAIANEKAIVADANYQKQSPRQDFYQVYMAHNRHMLAYACIQRGQSAKALNAINEMAAAVPPEWVKENAAVVDGFTAMPLEVLVRFGKWDEVLAAPEPPEFLPIARAMRHMDRGIAYAAKGDVAAAKKEQSAFAAAKANVPEEAIFSNNKGHDLLGVAEKLLAGEILYREGKVEESIASLKEAIVREDQLRYAEPPDWLRPVRHTLGAVLVTEGRVEEAAKVYRADLAKYPDNGWSLYGLARSLEMCGKEGEATAAMARFKEAWADADFELTSSCLCLPGRK